MSYFDSLSSWQNAGQAINNHTAQIEQDNMDTKASTITEKFANVDKLLGEAGGGIGGLGGGVHIGMRMYRKAQRAKKALMEAKGKAQDLLDKGKALKGKLQGDTKPDGKSNNADNESGNGAGEKEPTQSKNGEEDGKGGEDADVDETPKPSSEEAEPDTSNPEPKLDTDPNQPDLLDAKGQAKADFNKQQETSQTDTSEELNVGSQESDASGIAGRVGESSITEPAKVSEAPKLDSIQEDVGGEVEEPPSGALGEAPKLPAEATTGTADAPEPPSGALGEAPKPPLPEGTENTVFSQDGSVRIGQQANAESAGAEAPKSGTAEMGGGVEADAEQGVKSAVDGASQGAKDGITAIKQGGQDILDQTASKATALTDKVSGVMSKGTDVLAQTGEKVGTTVAKSGLEATEGVMDFLGPIGELLGAGLALGSFFHDLFRKHHEEKEQADVANQQTTMSQSTGISTTSMATANVKSNVVGTMV